jgi:hypothetical protein
MIDDIYIHSMFFCDMFNKFVHIALISTTKSTLKSKKNQIDPRKYGIIFSYLVFGFDRSASFDKSTGVLDCPA